ncbi:MAG: U32 family peptidase [Elusimicrobiota bacterium]|jgi:collagenase-like PrtC family protease
MRIVAGVKNYAEAEALLRLGADEVYGGLAVVPNHRRTNMSFQSMDELKAAVRLARSKGKRFSFLVNQPSYDDRYRKTLAVLRELDGEGLGACIVRELPMMESARALRLKARMTVSSLALCFNLPAMKRFKELGASRVVLPFHMVPRESQRLIDNPYGLETEVFFHADFCCANIDPACRLWRLTRRDQTCRYSYRKDGARWKMPEADVREKMRAVHGFFGSGAGYLKLVRMKDFMEELEVFKFARILSRLYDRGVGEEEFARLGEKLYFSVSRHARAAWKKR